MKTINYLLAVALAGAALTGCSKKDNNYTMAADVALPMRPEANISLVVQTMGQQPGSLLHWDMGTIAISQIQFDGVQFVGGDALDLAEYTDKNIRSIDIVNPSVSTLGVIAVPFGAYERAFFGLKLAPIGMTYTGNLRNSLFLSGSYYSVTTADAMAKAPVDPVPVQIIINDPLLMRSTWLANVTLNQLDYSAAFAIDVNNITLGITEAMLNNATRTNGVIYITIGYNQNLYGIIIKNLENHLMNVQMSVKSVNAGSSNTVANSHLQ